MHGQQFTFGHVLHALAVRAAAATFLSLSFAGNLVAAGQLAPAADMIMCHVQSFADPLLGATCIQCLG
jgi:hypothetical protein